MTDRTSTQREPLDAGANRALLGVGTGLALVVLVLALVTGNVLVAAIMAALVVAIGVTWLGYARRRSG